VRPEQKCGGPPGAKDALWRITVAYRQSPDWTRMPSRWCSIRFVVVIEPATIPYLNEPGSTACRDALFGSDQSSNSSVGPRSREQPRRIAIAVVGSELSSIRRPRSVPRSTPIGSHSRLRFAVASIPRACTSPPQRQRCATPRTHQRRPYGSRPSSQRECQQIPRSTPPAWRKRTQQSARRVACPVTVDKPG